MGLIKSKALLSSLGVLGTGTAVSVGGVLLLEGTASTDQSEQQVPGTSTTVSTTAVSASSGSSTDRTTDQVDSETTGTPTLSTGSESSGSDQESGGSQDAGSGDASQTSEEDLILQKNDDKRVVIQLQVLIL